MARIDEIFNSLRADQRTALMPFVTGGYPSLDVTRRVLPVLQSAGASIVEIGIPFSDPIADGPVIAASMHEVLQAGVTPAAIFDMVKSVRSKLTMGLVAMVSQSIVDRVGVEVFTAQASDAGFDGLIVPDADTFGGVESPASQIVEASRAHGLSCSFLIAPTSNEKRVETLAALSSGFLYVLARAGLTGEQDAAPDVTDRVRLIRNHTDLPLAVGFGISTPAHVRAVTESADAAIVGSALVRRMKDSDDPVAAAASFVRDLATGLATHETVRG